MEWNPAQPVNAQTPLRPLFSCLGFGQSDVSSWDAIIEKYESHQTYSVGQLEAMWSNEFMQTGMPCRTWDMIHRLSTYRCAQKPSPRSRHLSALRSICVLQVF